MHISQPNYTTPPNYMQAKVNFLNYTTPPNYMQGKGELCSLDIFMAGKEMYTFNAANNMSTPRHPRNVIKPTKGWNTPCRVGVLGS